MRLKVECVCLLSYFVWQPSLLQGDKDLCPGVAEDGDACAIWRSPGGDGHVDRKGELKNNEALQYNCLPQHVHFALMNFMYLELGGRQL